MRNIFCRHFSPLQTPGEKWPHNPFFISFSSTNKAEFQGNSSANRRAKAQATQINSLAAGHFHAGVRAGNHAYDQVRSALVIKIMQTD
jgi:hypothetical protein